jgi:hypothetical protein
MMSSMATEMAELSNYMKPSVEMILSGDNTESADLIMFMEARIIFRDFDVLFQRFMNEC